MLKTWEGSLGAGGFYEMECHMFHMARGTVGEDTVTLVAQAAPRREYSEIVLDSAELGKHRDLSVADTSRLLERLQALDV